MSLNMRIVYYFFVSILLICIACYFEDMPNVKDTLLAGALVFAIFPVWFCIWDAVAKPNENGNASLLKKTCITIEQLYEENKLLKQRLREEPETIHSERIFKPLNDRIAELEDEISGFDLERREYRRQIDNLRKKNAEMKKPKNRVNKNRK